MYKLITSFNKNSENWTAYTDYLVGLDFEKFDSAKIFLSWWETEGRECFQEYCELTGDDAFNPSYSN